MTVRVQMQDQGQASAIRLRVWADSSFRGVDRICAWCYFNPVALALARLTGRTWSVCNTFATIPESMSRAGLVRVDLPPEVDQWLDRWDHGSRAIEPLQFDVPYDPNLKPREQLTGWFETGEED